MWGISRNIRRAETVELSAVFIPTKPAVPSGPSSPIVPRNSADGNPCCHTSLEDGHGQAWGEEIRLVVNASFLEKSDKKISSALTEWVRAALSEQEENDSLLSPTRAELWELLGFRAFPQQQPSLNLVDSHGFLFSRHLLLWGSYGWSAPFSQPMWAHPREAPSQEDAKSHPGTHRAAGPGLPEAICRAMGLLSSGKCTTSAWNLMWDAVFLYITGTGYLVLWQASSDHICQVLFSLGLRAKEELIWTDFSLHSPEALIPLSKHLFKLLSRNNTSK